MVPGGACVLCLLTCHPSRQLGSRGSGLRQAPSSWEAREVFTRRKQKKRIMLVQ